MLSPHKLRKGDIILTEGKKPYSRIIQWFTESPWSHAVLYCGNNRVIEADIGGVQISPLSKYSDADGRLAVLRTGLGPAHRREVINFCRRQLGKGYNYLGLLTAALGIKRRIPPEERPSYTCTELIGVAYAEAAGIRLTQEPPELATPDALFRSGQLKKVFLEAA